MEADTFADDFSIWRSLASIIAILSFVLMTIQRHQNTRSSRIEDGHPPIISTAYPSFQHAKCCGSASLRHSLPIFVAISRVISVGGPSGLIQRCLVGKRDYEFASAKKLIVRGSKGLKRVLFMRSN